MKLIPLLGSLAALALLCARPASAQGLFSIPTADTIERGHVSASIENDGASRLGSPDTLRLVSVYAGVTDFLMAGVDTSITGTTAVRPNITLRLTRKDAATALAAGFQNVGVRSFGEQAFAVLSQRFGWGRLHAGWTHDTRNELMLGAEHPVSHRVLLQADYITGAGNFATAGLQYSLSDRVNVSAGYMRANRRSDGDGLFLSLGCEGVAWK